jgi:hypothetical protein
MRYHGFDIEIVADESKQFKAVIKRADGGIVRTAVPTAGANVSAIFTPLFSSKEDAVTEAKRAIDGSTII